MKPTQVKHPHLLGRRTMQKRLMGLLKSPTGGPTRITVSGPAGVGKSAFLDFAHICLGEGSMVRVGESPAPLDTLASPARPATSRVLFLDDADRLEPGQAERILEFYQPEIVVASQVTATQHFADVCLSLQPLSCEPEGPAEKLLLLQLPAYYRGAAMMDERSLRWLVEKSGGLPSVLEDIAAAVGPDGLSPLVAHIARQNVPLDTEGRLGAPPSSSSMMASLRRLTGAIPLESARVLRQLAQFEGSIDLPVAAASCGVSQAKLRAAMVPLLERHVAMINTVRGGYPLVSVPDAVRGYLRFDEAYPTSARSVPAATRHAEACLQVARLRSRRRRTSPDQSPCAEHALTAAHHRDLVRAAQTLVDLGRIDGLAALLDSAENIWMHPSCAVRLGDTLGALVDDDDAPWPLVLAAFRLRVCVNDWPGASRILRNVSSRADRPDGFRILQEALDAAREGVDAIARWSQHELINLGPDGPADVVIPYVRAACALRLAHHHPHVAHALVQRATSSLVDDIYLTPLSSGARFLLEAARVRLAKTPSQTIQAASTVEKLLTSCKTLPPEVIILAKSVLMYGGATASQQTQDTLGHLAHARRLAREQTESHWPAGSLPAPSLTEPVARLVELTKEHTAELRQAARGDDALALLTPRQLEVARCAASGMTNRQIGRHLSISEWTVVNHLRVAMAKLECPARTHLWKVVGSDG